LSSPSPSSGTKVRRGYIDWLRGLAVVVMIEAHTFDAWTAQPSREGLAFWYSLLIAGWAAPIFLFMAGVSVALASSSCERRLGCDAFTASKTMMRRGLQILGLALLFRVQAWLLSPGATVYGILKVDILNIMGPAISGAALVWGLVPRTVPRIVALAAVTSGFGLLTPIIRASTSLAALPDPIEWYLRPWPGRTTFTFFPWAGFVFAGAAIGVLIDRVRDGRGEGRLNARFAIAGAAIALAAFAASFLPSPYAESNFWTSSPCFFFLRVGVLIVLLPLAYLWARRPWLLTPRFSPLQQFGRTSLFVYWIHVEMVYGILSYPLHRALTLPQVLVAFVLFTLAMYGLSILKTRIMNRWNNGHEGVQGSTLLVTGGRST
jgi:uncharacterized membrane protein